MRRQVLKTALAKYPALYSGVKAGYTTAALGWYEIATLVRLGPSLLLRPLLNAGKLWRRELPVQAALQHAFAWPDGVVDSVGMLDWCGQRGLPVSSGRHSIYLPPQTLQSSVFSSFMAQYPAGVGLKISRVSGGVNHPYLIPRAGHNLQRSYSMTHRQQALTFNFLHLKGIAPRLYDVVELEDNHGALWAAYVVEHVDGQVADELGCRRTVEALRDLERDGLIRLVAPEGWQGVDFRTPDCNGNLVRLPDGQLRYVDVHSFVLDRYEKHLVSMGQEAARASHFGSKSFVLGGSDGRYLYQEIPGVPLPAKRSPRERMVVWDELLRASALSLEGKVIFDIGSNVGLMSAEYLRRGARWIHGWDMPKMVEQTRNVLLSIGCTRFSLTAGLLSNERELFGELPAHLKTTAVENGVVNYLAMRRHIGWIQALASLPWRHMLYEGHEGDQPLDAYLAELNRVVKVKVIGSRRVTDANSADREIALIERQ